MLRSVISKIGITLSIVLAAASHCFAQNPMPAAYSGYMKVSYVRSWDVTSPQSNPDTVMTRTLKDVKQTTQYIDGLGRPIQTVVKQGSVVTGGTAYDFVNSNVYDDFGREVNKYLPFSA